MPTEKPLNTEINFQNPKTGSRTLSMPKLKVGKKIILLCILAGFFIILLTLLAVANQRGNRQPQSEAPVPTPLPTFIEARASSLYASDSAILKVEENLIDIEKRIQEADFYETQLNPPVLDLKVSF